MNICENCFNDEEIQMNIRNQNKRDDCDVCGGKDMMVVDIEELEDFFIEILNLYEKDDSGQDIVSNLQDEWDLFSNRDIAYKVISFFLSIRPFSYSIVDKVKYVDSVNEYTEKWQDLKKEIRTKTRFYSSLMAYFDDNGALLKGNLTLREGESFFRARIVPDGRPYLMKKDMGCPPVDKASPGRANPIGIPYLYLCKSQETTLYETRSVFLDKVTIGTFRLVRNLNVLDFTSSISLFLAFNADEGLIEEVARHRLRQQISSDLSKPLRRYDTELEYVPTQSICEYCKLKDLDGIMFRSSLHKDGLNLVLFDEKNAQCIKVKTVEINRVEIGYK